ncbi:hypothetical protein RUND412_003509 [Rhizina undulata]
MSRDGINAGIESGMCKIQAIIIQWFLPADALFCFCMALNVYLTVFKKYTTKRLKKLEIYYVIVCYGLPGIPAIAFLFGKNEHLGPIYGSAVLWCWISEEWSILRIAGFYGPVWIILGFTFFIYVLAGRVIFTLRGSLRQFAKGGPHNNSHSNSAPKVQSPLPPPPPPAMDRGELGKKNPITVHSEVEMSRVYVKDGEDVRIDPLATYTCVIEAGAVPRPRVGGNSAVEANTAAWAYTRCAMLFFLALVITWLPSSVNRVYTLIYPNATSFGLNFAAVLVLPAQGFWNGLIYIVTTLPACKEFCRDTWQKIRYPYDRFLETRTRKLSRASSLKSMVGTSTSQA